MAAASNPLVAIAWMGGALASFTMMAVSVRELSSDMHAFQMLFIRSAIGVAILALVLSFRGWARLRSRRLGGHLLRNVIHFAGQTFWIIGLSVLPLATVSAIEFTTPLWGALLTVLFLGEHLTRGRLVAFALGIVGVLIILRPGLAVIEAGALIMLACTFCFGATNAITKWLTRSDEALTILFYMVALQTLFGAVASLFVWSPVTLAHAPLLGVLAVTGLSAHYCLARALGAADAVFVMPFEFLRLPIMALIGFLAYAESLEAVTLAGAALIFAGNYYSLRQERRDRA
jgi:drug/metabolite transporter (DMT)-like permease